MTIALTDTVRVVEADPATLPPHLQDVVMGVLIERCGERIVMLPTGQDPAERALAVQLMRVELPFPAGKTE